VLGIRFRGLGVVMNCVLIVFASQGSAMHSLFVLLGLVVFPCLIVMGRPFMIASIMMVLLPSL